MKRWTKEEIETLKRLFPDQYTAQVAKELNRTAVSVEQKAHKLKIKKSATFKAFLMKESLELIKAYRFNAENRPNSPQLTEEAKAKMAKTHFKKGHLPHNTKFDGYERLDKYGNIEIRIGLNKFMPKHRLIYEQHHGPLPKGHFVVFQNRDNRDYSIENLILVNRAENMKRNTIHKYPKFLQEEIKLMFKLKKEIEKCKKN